jgi:hypothetical protein
LIPRSLSVANILFLSSAVAWGGQAPLPQSPDPDRKGKPIVISEGKIPLRDFLKFLSDYTGLPVLHNSSDPALENREIQVVHDIQKADEAVVKKILEMNGVRVYTQELAGGSRVMKVESMLSNFPEDPDGSGTIVIVGDSGAPRPPSGPPRAPKPAAAKEPPAAKETDIEGRLLKLEKKVQGLQKAIELRGADPAAPPPPVATEKLTPRQRERVEALNRNFEERMNALRKEHQEELDKLLKSFSDEAKARPKN